MTEDITELVQAVGAGDAKAYERLFDRVYNELKLLARRQIRISDAGSPTLDTTGLVHDTYVKMARPESLALSGRKHFFALAAKAMRQVVIDHARAHVAGKRGGGEARSVSMDSVAELAAAQVAPEKLLLLDQALKEMEVQQPRLSALIELRFFAGLELEQIAEMQEVSERTLNRDWRRARAELYASLYD